MLPQGFSVFSIHRDAPAGEFSSLTVSPVVAVSKDLALEAFAQQSPERLVVMVASMDDLGRYRRDLLALAEDRGLPLSLGLPT